MYRLAKLLWNIIWYLDCKISNKNILSSKKLGYNPDPNNYKRPNYVPVAPPKENNKRKIDISQFALTEHEQVVETNTYKKQKLINEIFHNKNYSNTDRCLGKHFSFIILNLYLKKEINDKIESILYKYDMESDLDCDLLKRNDMYNNIIHMMNVMCSFYKNNYVALDEMYNTFINLCKSIEIQIINDNKNVEIIGYDNELYKQLCEITSTYNILYCHKEYILSK